ncbi:MAG: efflux RND transporter periplasmic adaptor subunit [Opitutales bacterium]|nr:efflux RND transporter periplasmic adaptor subunit [Opitutales bacterium]
MKTLLKIALPLLILAALVLAGMSRIRTVVSVEEAVTGTAADAVTGTVKVFANLDIKVKTEVQGRIAETPFAINQKVKKGDTLMVLEAQDIRNQIREKVIQLKAAQKRLQLPLNQVRDIQNVEDEIARIKQAIEFGNASQSDLEKRQRDLQKIQNDFNYQQISREEQAELFEATVANLQYQLSRMTLVAPMDGTITEQYKWPGDYIWTGNEVLRLVSDGRWVELTLAEEDSAYVEKGQKAKVRLASYPDRTFEATVTALNSTANADTKTRAVFLSIDAPDEILIPGLTGEAVLVKAERKNTVLVPRRALIGNRVYVVKNGIVEIRPVTPGFLGLEKAEILSGIVAGEQVVTDGQSLLRDGDKVEILGAKKD